MVMLRRLEEKDAVLMLEWMGDPDITRIFSNNFSEYTLEMVQNFIKSSFDTENQNFAVVDENDEYQGTISLKNISSKDKNAEYAVVFRKKAHGTGTSKQATYEILRYAFEVLNLEKVYLNVLEDNLRARKFYEKIGFKQEGIFIKHKFIEDRFQNLYWYRMLKEEWNWEHLNE